MWWGLPRENYISTSVESTRHGARAVEGPVKDLENPRTRYRNFSDTEIVLSVAKPNEQFAVLLAGDDGLVVWTRKGSLAEASGGVRLGRRHRPLNIRLWYLYRLKSSA